MVMRVVAMMLAALIAESGVFAYSHRDLLWLRGARLAQAPDAAAVRQYATAALQRSSLTRAQLETIVTVAHHAALPEVEAAALQRAVTDFPSEYSLMPRLADALRRSGQLDAAETIYLKLLAQGAHEP